MVTRLAALLLLVAVGSCRGDASARGEPRHLAAQLPGAAAFDAKLAAKLDAAWAARDAQYRPRTRHLRSDGSPQYTNRLFLETSPYLRQHAHNPVNWYPWGDEAFATARRLGRPVLLSVGYSTCHWCHVMEEESFEDEEVARYLNENYVAIKVDREERPDVDAVYMAAVQALSGRGGWPMTVWLTADRKPFYGGSYFPTTAFLQLLRKFHEAYQREPEHVVQAAAQLSQAIEAQLASAHPAGLPTAATLRQAQAFYAARFDAAEGGLAGAPKFPSSLPIPFLLRYQRRTDDQAALRMATLTLEKMAAGGIHDQIGGGFHRYSTDARWLVPHFEKMLYDNALLAVDYLEGYQVTGRDDFAGVARRIFRYVDREMRAPGGAFYSASDADSPAPDGHRAEGWFFTWTPAEIEAVLGRERATAIERHYDVTPAGNFDGRSILHVTQPAADAHLRSAIADADEQLLAARARRPRPLRDDKILTAWNGLMISAFARAALVLDDDAYSLRAREAASFILGHLRNGDERLQRSYKDGRAEKIGYLDDYAFFVAALLDLFEATGEPRWLDEAVKLDAVVEAHYEDKKSGGFYSTSDDAERLLAREKPSYDGAEPSGSSIEVMNLLRLAELSERPSYRERAERAMRAVGEKLRSSPAALAHLLQAVDFYLDAPKEIVIVTPRSRAEARPFLQRLRGTFLPNRVLVVLAAADLARLRAVVPLVEGKQALDGKPTAYVCERHSCQLPTTDPLTFQRQIQTVDRLRE